MMITEEEPKAMSRHAKLKAQLKKRMHGLREKERLEEELKKHEKVFNERYENDLRTMAEIGDVYRRLMSLVSVKE